MRVRSIKYETAESKPKRGHAGKQGIHEDQPNRAKPLSFRRARWHKTRDAIQDDACKKFTQKCNPTWIFFGDKPEILCIMGNVHESLAIRNGITQAY